MKLSQICEKKLINVIFPTILKIKYLYFVWRKIISKKYKREKIILPFILVLNIIFAFMTYLQSFDINC